MNWQIFELEMRLPVIFLIILTFYVACNKDNCTPVEVNILFSNETDKDWTLTGGFEGCEEQYYDFEFLIESGLSIGTKTESSLVEPESVLLEVYVRDEFGAIVTTGILYENINPKDDIRIRIANNNGYILEFY